MLKKTISAISEINFARGFNFYWNFFSIFGAVFATYKVQISTSSYIPIEKFLVSIDFFISNLIYNFIFQCWEKKSEKTTKCEADLRVRNEEKMKKIDNKKRFCLVRLQTMEPAQMSK